jgi:chromosome partitioning protein
MRAFILAFVATKGGAGRSTLAINLAIAAASDGRRVLVVDCDAGQTSIHTWSSALREAPAPTVRVARHETLSAVIEAARKDGFELIVVDVPSSGDKVAQLAASMADHILVPVRASMFDLQALRDTVELLHVTADMSEPPRGHANALGKAAVVLNGVSPHASRAQIQDIRATVARYSIDVVAQLGDRAAFARSLNDGEGVTEWDPGSPAAREIEKLHEYVLGVERKSVGATRAKRMTAS